jgi:hypothetical protein
MESSLSRLAQSKNEDFTDRRCGALRIEVSIFAQT